MSSAEYPFRHRDKYVSAFANSSIPEGPQDASLEVQVTTASKFDLKARADSLAYTVVPSTVNFGSNITRHYRSVSKKPIQVFRENFVLFCG